MKKVMFVFGTRPEIIKLIPIINDLNVRGLFQVMTCSTGQQKQLLNQMLASFNIPIDFELDVMEPNQSLSGLSSSILIKISEVLEEAKPDMVFVHGDTTTAFIAGLAAFYKKIKVAHIEAGLRTLDKYSPYPEEINRTLIGKLADVHYSPTEQAKENLLKEGVDERSIVVTGNTGIDTLKLFSKLIDENKLPIEEGVRQITRSKNVLITFHRRENHGPDTEKFLDSIRYLAKKFSEIHFVFPVHLNPNVKGPVEKTLGGIANIHLLPPLPYETFIFALKNSFFVISDSGGVQEEATTLGKPVLLYRDTTERPEAIDCDNIILVKQGSLLKEKAAMLIEDESAYKRMSVPNNVFGDGKASSRVSVHLEKILP